MKEPKGRPFSDEEIEVLKESLKARGAGRDRSEGTGAPDRSGSIPCPHCGAALKRRDVPPRSDVSYVRERVWLLCGACGRSAVVDRPRRKGRG